MSNLTVGQLVRINPDLIPETIKDDDLIDDLGVPGLMRHAILEIIEIVNDPARGEMGVCRISNPTIFKDMVPGVKEVKYEGELYFQTKSLVPANMKITVDYVLNLGKTKDEMITELFAFRKTLQAKGMDKRNKEMRANWKEIQILRGEIVGPMPAAAGIASVYLPKYKLQFEINTNQIPTGEAESILKFKRFLSSKVRNLRSSRKKMNLEEKIIFDIPVLKIGGVYTENQVPLKAYEEMMKTTLEKDKKPTDAKATYVGIEVEFIYSGRYDKLKELLIQKKLHRYVCLKQDRSVKPCHNTGYHGLELTLLCKSQEVEDVLKRLDSVFADPMIDAYANRSCGLHVHLDVRKRNADLVFRNLVRIQNILRGSQPIGRIKNHHCKVTPTDVLEKKEWEGGGTDYRYLVVNGWSYARHKSIEIRVHEGTTNCEDIYNWVVFLDSVANHTVELPKNQVKFAEDLVGKYDIDIPIGAIDYIDRRIERFNSLAV